MREKKDLKQDKKGYTVSNVTDRGRAICDEWSKNGYTSRMVVQDAGRAIFLMKKNRTEPSYVEALSCLFALDARSKEKYKSVRSRFFKYFSWRRENRAIDRLRSSLRISYTSDIICAIEQGLENSRNDLQKFRERAAAKSKGADKDREPVADVKKEEVEPKKTVLREAIPELDELGRESLNEIKARSPVARDAGQKKTPTASAHNAPTGKAEQRPENAVPRSASTQDANAQKGTPEHVSTGYGNPVDPWPAIDVAQKEAEEERKREEEKKKKEKDSLNFIDEVMIDNMIKGVDDIVWHNPLDDVRDERLRREQKAAKEAAAKAVIQNKKEAPPPLTKAESRNEKEALPASTGERMMTDLESDELGRVTDVSVKKSEARDEIHAKSKSAEKEELVQGSLTDRK